MTLEDLLAIVRRRLRYASFRCPATLYYLIDTRLMQAPITSEGRLIIEAPPEEYQWLRDKPEPFQAMYLKGLEAYLAQRQRTIGGSLEPPAQMVVVRAGEHWRAFFEPEEPAVAAEQGCTSAGSFLVLDDADPLHVAWPHPGLPRRPTHAEQTADPADLVGLLSGDALASPLGRRWEEGEEHTVCGSLASFHRCSVPLRRPPRHPHGPATRPTEASPAISQLPEASATGPGQRSLPPAIVPMPIRPGRRWRPRKRVWLLALLVLLLGILWVARRHLPFSPYRTPTALTVLVTGLDDDGRADAVLVAYVTSGGAQALVVPRDTFCSGGSKLNSMYRKLGLSGFRSLVSQITGHPIDRHLAVPFPKVASFLDRAFPDGLVVEVPYTLRYRDRAGGFSYSIPKGQQRLRGESLGWFLRDRYSDPRGRGEGARVERWGIFLRAAVADLVKSKSLSRYHAVAVEASRFFDTDLNASDLLRMASAYSGSKQMRVSYMPGRPVRLGDVYFIQLDKEAARQQARLALSGIVPPADLMVYVVNGTSEHLLAQDAASRVRNGFGFTVTTGNAASAWQQGTVVAYYPPDLVPLASAVAHELAPSARTRRLEGNPSQPTLEITVGEDYARRNRR